MIELEPNPQERLMVLREAAGLDLLEMAGRLDINFPSYRDLEMHDDEIMTCLDIVQVLRLCAILAIDPRQIFAKHPEQLIKPIPFETLARLAQDYMTLHEMGWEEFSDAVGWEADYLQSMFNDSTKVQTWSLDGLNDLCSLVGVEWLAVLMALYRESANR